MAERKRFEVAFWGVRGSIASPGPDTLRYGGDTPCVEIRCGDHVLIFDAGTGIRRLGHHLVAAKTRAADLFLSHTHYDHVMGLPFFCFAYKPGNTLRIWSGHLQPDSDTETALRRFMSPPLFPISPDVFKAKVSFHDFQGGETVEPRRDIEVRTIALKHPNRAVGYRVEFDGRSVCYLTDTEHAIGKPDREVLAFMDRADIVIYDAMFTDDEFPDHVGFGHSTWQEGVRLAHAAGIKTLVLFHHLPERDDDALDTIAAEAKRAFPGAVVARAGLTLTP